MKRTFTLLTATFFLVTSIFAQKPLHKGSFETAGSLLKIKKESAVKSNNFSHLSANRIVKKHPANLKSAQAIKQRLDSIISRSWDETTSQMMIDYKEKYTYDTKGNLTQYVDYEQDQTTGMLSLSFKEIISYDANGNLAQSLDYFWDATSGQWVGEYKIVNTYDANRNLTQYIRSIWDETTSQFLDIYKGINTYNSNGNLTQYLDYWWDDSTNQWVYYMKGDNLFDASGNQTQSLDYVWDGYFTNQWINSGKNEFTYNANGNLIQSLGYNWDESSGQWTFNGKDTYVYDANGNNTENINSNWDETTSQWVPDWKDVYSFDTEGNNIQDLYSSWDITTSQWMPDSKSVFTYDNTYTFNDLIVPMDYFDIFTHMITDAAGYQWNSITSDWDLNNNTSLYFSEQNITSTNKLNADITQVYPNPFSKSISFSISGSNSGITFELFDMQGRKLFAKAIGSNEKVNMEEFRSGMYLYKLNVDGKVQIGKLVKE